MSFVKVYATILDSSIWAETHATRIVWITLLAMADAHGRVSASVGGLARRAVVSLEECRRALDVLSSPDPDDRSGVDEGRRIRALQGGWEIVNHRAYRDLRTPSQAKTAERVRRFRERERERERASVTCNVVTPGNATTRAEAEAEAEAEEDPDPERERARVPAPATPATAGSPSKAPKKTRAKKTPKPRAWRRVPEGWQPTEAHRALAAELEVNLDAELPRFRDHEFAKPKTDPDATFRTWLRNAQAFRAGGGGGGRRGPVQPNHPGGWDPKEFLR